MMSVRDRIILVRIKKLLKTGNIKKLTKIVNSGKYNEDILTDDLILKIIDAGYTASDGIPHKIKSSLKYFNYMFGNDKYNPNLIDFFDETFLTPKIIETAIRRGYSLSDRSSKIISGNLEYVTMILFELLPKRHTNHSLSYLCSDIKENLKYVSNDIGVNALIKFVKRAERFGGGFGDEDFIIVLNQLDIDKEKYEEYIKKYVQVFGDNSLWYMLKNIDENKTTKSLIEFFGRKQANYFETPTFIKDNPNFIKELSKSKDTDFHYFLRDYDFTVLNEDEIDDFFIRLMCKVCEFYYDLDHIVRICKKENNLLFYVE